MSKQTDPGTHTTDYPMNRKAFLCLALFLGAGYPLLSLLNIFYISVESNVLFSGSVGANILWVFTNLFAALFFFVTFGTMIAVLCRKPTKQALPVVILSFGSLIYKYAVDLLFVYLFDGFPTGAPGFGRDLVSALFNLLPEAIEFLVIFLIARAVGGKYRSLVAVSASAARYLPDRGAAERYCPYPYKKIFDRTNPLLAGAFYASLVNLTMRLFSFVLGELSLTIGGGWAPSTAADWLAIFAEVLFEIVLSVAGFFFIRWLSGQIYSRVFAKQC